jgi:hypothetical protein
MHGSETGFTVDKTVFRQCLRYAGKRLTENGMTLGVPSGTSGPDDV